MYKALKWQTKNDFIRDYVTDAVSIEGVNESYRPIDRPKHVRVCFKSTLMCEIIDIKTHQGTKKGIHVTDIYVNQPFGDEPRGYYLKWPDTKAGIDEKKKFDNAIINYLNNTRELTELKNFLQQFKLENAYINAGLIIQKYKYKREELMVRIFEIIEDIKLSAMDRLDKLLMWLSHEIDRRNYEYPIHVDADFNNIWIDFSDHGVEEGRINRFANEFLQKVKMVVYSYKMHLEGLEK